MTELTEADRHTLMRVLLSGNADKEWNNAWINAYPVQSLAMLQTARSLVIAELAAKAVPDRDAMIDVMSNRFIMWPLPQTVCADLCATDSSYAFPRNGTNLLNASEASMMACELLDAIAPHLAALQARAEKAEAENARLKAALTRITKPTPSSCTAKIRIARVALESLS